VDAWACTRKGREMRRRSAELKGPPPEQPHPGNTGPSDVPTHLLKVCISELPLFYARLSGQQCLHCSQGLLRGGHWPACPFGLKAWSPFTACFADKPSFVQLKTCLPFKVNDLFWPVQQETQLVTAVAWQLNTGHQILVSHEWTYQCLWIPYKMFLAEAILYHILSLTKASMIVYKQASSFPSMTALPSYLCSHRHSP